MWAWPRCVCCAAWASTVDFPEAQTCCGQPHFNSGYHDEARELARHTLRTFDNGQTVVVPSGSCAAMIKLEYPRTFSR